MASQIIITLLILTGCLWPSCIGEEFTECIDVATDTFVMVVEDCASYIYCNGEDSFRDMCPNQTYFDAKSQECAFDDDGVCLREGTLSAVSPVAAEEKEDKSEDTQAETVEEATEDGEKPTEIMDATPAPAVPPPAIASRPQCEPTVDSFHPHSQRCEYYYSCISGYLTIVRCPYKYGWNYATEQCKPLAETECYSP